jgi:hypothetical protein
MLNVFPMLHTPKQSTCQHAIYFNVQYFTLFPAYLYQKDKRSLPGNLQSSRLLCFPPGLIANVLILTAPPPAPRRGQWIPGFFAGGREG